MDQKLFLGKFMGAKNFLEKFGPLLGQFPASKIAQNAIKELFENQNILGS
jgi:hypothetical protein